MYDVDKYSVINVSSRHICMKMNMMPRAVYIIHSYALFGKWFRNMYAGKSN